MSALTLESVDLSTRNESEISTWDFIKDVAGNRPYYILEAPKFALDVVINTMGVAGCALNRVSAVCQKVVNTENFIALFQDVMVIPSRVSKCARSTVSWIKGEEDIFCAFNQVRKTVGLLASTLGDFVNSCDAVESLSVSIFEVKDVLPFRRWALFTEKAGAIGSGWGAYSRICDYFYGDIFGDIEDEESVKLSPASERERSQLVYSKNLWDLARDVSILAISWLTVTCGGFAAVPMLASVSLSGSILGSRLVSYYREVQIKTLEEARPGILIAKNQLKG